jgi:two-component system phosphate regulon response regulator PhoB
MSTVLIVDDESSLRTLIRLTLNTGRFSIVEADDGRTALDEARRHRPDLIFLDWAMPGRSGVEVLRELRADEKTRDAKVVMLTARRREVDRAAALEAGANGYMTKPFSPVELLDKVREVLGPDALL